MGGVVVAKRKRKERKTQLRLLGDVVVAKRKEQNKKTQLGLLRDVVVAKRKRKRKENAAAPTGRCCGGQKEKEKKGKRSCAYWEVLWWPKGKGKERKTQLRLLGGVVVPC